MSKKVIDWDDLRAEMLERSDVKAAFDAQERQERLRDMLAQWRSHAGCAENGGECPDGVQNGSQRDASKS